MRFPTHKTYKDSGVAWLGQVPEHWAISPLKYVAEFKSGGTPDKANREFWDGDVPWASAKDLKTADLFDTIDHITSTALEVGAATLVEPGTLLVVVRGMILARLFPVAKACVPMAINQDLKAVVAKRGVNPDYLAWLLRGSEPETLSRLDEAAHGTKALRMDAWTAMRMPIPPLDEQQKVSSFIVLETAKIDALAEEQKRLIELLKEKRQAVISQAVTKGLDPNVPMKHSGVEWLGRVPQAWTVRSLRTLASVVRGASPRPAGDPQYFDGDHIPWVTVAEITKDALTDLTETETYLTEAGAENSRLFRSGTVIYSNSGATLGVPKILRVDACANDGVVGFERLSDLVEPIFLYHYLSCLTTTIRDMVRQGSGQPNLNTGLVKAILIALPTSPLNH